MKTSTSLQEYKKFNDSGVYINLVVAVSLASQ